MKKLTAWMMAFLLLLAPCAMAQEDEAEILAMQPVVDSIMRAICVEDETIHDAEDAEYFWSVLYLMGVNWSGFHELCVFSEDYSTIRIPRQVMQEYATAIFCDYQDLLPLPEDSVIVYDEGWDAFILPLSDMGDTHTMLDEYHFDDEGALHVAASLRDWEDNVFFRMNFVMLPNPYADAVVEPVYLYSVAEAVAAE